MAGYSIVKRQRKYYKNGVEVPPSSITDFGSYRYFKNVVTTKYWKEITTGSKELEYACWKSYFESGLEAGYIYTVSPIPAKGVLYYTTDGQLGWGGNLVTSSSEFNSPSWVLKTNGAGEDYITYDTTFMGVASTAKAYRYPEGDLYIDTTVTETVEGTPDDYTYTTEEITPVEVTADDEYDYTEFVPSTQFDYYEGTNKLYQLAKVKRSYYKDGVVIPESSITDFGGTKYYKNIVTTKYWKEVTTNSKELEYGCYVGSGYITYVKAPIGVENTMHADCVDMCSYVSSSSKLTYHPPNALGSLTEESYTLVGITFVRQRDKDLYIDTTTTTAVEGTPDDYTYTTEEIVPVEVSADKDYDYTEVVPSTQFDYYTDRLLSYEIIKGVK